MLLRAVKLAVAFLTVVPVRLGVDEASDTDLATSRFAYPAVGAAIGLLLAALSWALSRSGAPPGLSAFAIVAAGAMITGGLHIDGLADTADGLFLSGGPARRLDAMRDPHVGSYGLTAVMLVILGKYAVLSGLAGSTRAWAVLAAAAIGRSLILVSAGATTYARPQGTGRVLVEATTLRDAFWASAFVLAAGAGLGGRAGLVASTLALGLTWGSTKTAAARLGGVTGDTLGAMVETGELLVLLTIALLGPAFSSGA